MPTTCISFRHQLYAIFYDIASICCKSLAYLEGQDLIIIIIINRSNISNNIKLQNKRKTSMFHIVWHLNDAWPVPSVDSLCAVLNWPTRPFQNWQTYKRQFVMMNGIAMLAVSDEILNYKLLCTWTVVHFIECPVQCLWPAVVQYIIIAHYYVVNYLGLSFFRLAAVIMSFCWHKLWFVVS